MLSKPALLFAPALLLLLLPSALPESTPAPSQRDCLFFSTAERVTMLTLMGDEDEDAATTAREVKANLVGLNAPADLLQSADTLIANYQKPVGQRASMTDPAVSGFLIDWLVFVVSQGDEADTYANIGQALTGTVHYLAARAHNDFSSSGMVKVANNVNDQLDSARKKCRNRRECTASVYDPLVQLRLLMQQTDAGLDDAKPAVQKIINQLAPE